MRLYFRFGENGQAARSSHEMFDICQASVEDLQLPAAVTISPEAMISQALDLMLEREFSQLPVLDAHKKLLGYVSLASLQTHLEAEEARSTDKVAKWMYSFGKGARRGGREPYHLITPETPLAELTEFLVSILEHLINEISLIDCLDCVGQAQLCRCDGRGAEMVPRSRDKV
jgi:cystathionine beta-synthase